MTTTFRIRKHQRNLAALCLIFFVAIGAASAYGMWTDAPKERRIYLVVFVTSFWGAMACLSLWGLLAYLRERLEIQNGLVTHQGVIGKREIDFDAVTDAHWKLGKNGGRLKLRTPTQRLTVHFDNFEPAERLSLYRFFRSTLPERPQRGWDLFCYKVALPHLDQSDGQNNHPGPDEILFSRTRWDWYFVPTILLSVVIGLVLGWKLQQRRPLVAPLVPLVLWLILRYSTPTKGMVSKRISAEPEVKRFLLFELWWLAIGIVGLVLFTVVKLPSPHALVLGSIACFLWFGGLLWRAHQVDRERNQRDLDHVDEATRRWRKEGQL
jgi:hypothetical protein